MHESESESESEYGDLWLEIDRIDAIVGDYKKLLKFLLTVKRVIFV
jgi:hypothetical protein